MPPYTRQAAQPLGSFGHTLYKRHLLLSSASQAQEPYLSSLWQLLMRQGSCRSVEQSETAEHHSCSACAGTAVWATCTQQHLSQAGVLMIQLADRAGAAEAACDWT